MNKIYKDSIEKAKAIATGIKNNMTELQGKGYDTSVVSRLTEMANQLEAEATKFDSMMQATNEQRSVCHQILADLKSLTNDSKTGIKSRFLQPDWSRFGLVDKR